MPISYVNDSEAQDRGACLQYYLIQDQHLRIVATDVQVCMYEVRYH